MQKKILIHCWIFSKMSAKETFQHGKQIFLEYKYIFISRRCILKYKVRDSLAIQWVGLGLSLPGSIPGCKTNIPQAIQRGQICII